MNTLTKLVLAALFLPTLAQAKTDIIDLNESAVVEAKNLTFRCTQQTDFTRTYHYMIIGHGDSNLLDTQLIDVKGDSTFIASRIPQESKQACLDLQAGLEAELLENASIPAQRHEQLIVFSNNIGSDRCLVQGGQVLKIDLAPQLATMETISLVNSNINISSESKKRYGFVDGLCDDAEVAVRAQADEIAQDHLL